MSNLSKNLRHLLNKAKLSENELSRRTGIPQQVINRILNHQNENPKLATLIALTKYFMVSINELISDELEIPLAKLNSSYLGWVEIPLLQWSEISDFCQKQDHIVARELVLTDVEGSRQLFGVRMLDDSMELKFEPGTLLIFEPNKKPQNKDFVIYKTHNNDAIHFRQVFFKNNSVLTKCLNPKLAGYKLTPVSQELVYLAVLVQSRANYSEK